MKHDETQAYAQDIRTQRGAGKIHAMNTPTITLNLLSALLLCAGASQAAEPQRMTTERPLDASVPHDATALQAWRKKQAHERQHIKPYGSGYESRGLGERTDSAAATTPLPATAAQGDGNARGSGSGAGSGGGSGGPGGRGR